MNGYYPHPGYPVNHCYQNYGYPVHQGIPTNYAPPINYGYPGQPGNGRKPGLAMRMAEQQALKAYNKNVVTQQHASPHTSQPNPKGIRYSAGPYTAAAGPITPYPGPVNYMNPQMASTHYTPTQYYTATQYTGVPNQVVPKEKSGLSLPEPLKKIAGGTWDKIKGVGRFIGKMAASKLPESTTGGDNIP